MINCLREAAAIVVKKGSFLHLPQVNG